MMIFRSPVLRSLRFVGLSRFSRVSVEKGLHDPSKHITMNHFPHNQYVDYWPVGQYPETYINTSVSPTTYQPQVEKVLIETYNAKYNKNVELNQIIDQDFNRLFPPASEENDIFSEQFFITELLSKLSSAIIVRESRYTWIKEQQFRADFSNYEYEDEINRINNFREFLGFYNTVIEKSVQISYFGLSSKIEQDPTAQQKHYYDELNNHVTGIKDLEVKRQENENFINKIMKMIHSV